MTHPELERSISARTTHGEESGATDYSEPLPDEALRIEANIEKEPQRNVIYWEPDDPDNPHNWPTVSLNGLSFCSPLNL
jgi:hypothetical protein